MPFAAASTYRNLNPEFLKEGRQSMTSFMRPDRIVIGADTTILETQRARELMARLCHPLTRSHPDNGPPECRVPQVRRQRDVGRANQLHDELTTWRTAWTQITSRCIRVLDLIHIADTAFFTQAQVTVAAAPLREYRLWCVRQLKIDSS
jgi:hypothetical protein